MSGFYIEGGHPFDGEIFVQGAKNAVLPILAATIVNGGENVVHNCPMLRDVDKTVEVLRGLGCSVYRDGNTLTVNSHDMNKCRIDDNLMRQMRSSIIFLGAIIAGCGRAEVSMPGGCEIGLRPIDIHLKALRMLGISISEKNGYIICEADKLRGADIHLDFPSVGATENIMLAAVSAEGVTVIRNAAREPEIVDLQNFLLKMGAKISGGGSDTVRIEGGGKLHGAEYTVMPDRIAAGTYLACCGCAGGRIHLNNVNPGDMSSAISRISEMGAEIVTGKNYVTMSVRGKLNSFGTIRTMPYPGFPTDMQSPFFALACTAKGTSVIVETIFENRFQNADELLRMGADIRIDGKTAVIVGVDRLHGAVVEARELRGGASLVAAGLGADGNTTVYNTEYVDRGYESFEKNLSACGAHIERFI